MKSDSNADGSQAGAPAARQAWRGAIQNRDEQFEMKRQVVLRTARISPDDTQRHRR
jgi:ribulose 1,5-bisphosphate carboxylase large subunit-like protein